MALPKTLNDREHRKFREDNNGGTVVAVSLSSGLSLPEYDYLSVDYTNSTTETYTFKSGGSGGTTVSTIVVVYTDSTKENVSTVTKS